MLKNIKGSLKLRRAQKQLELKQAEYATKQYELAIEQITEATNIVQDEDRMSGWFAHGESGNVGMSVEEHSDMLQNAYRLYHNNPHARAVVRNLSKFILGKGPNVIPEDDNESNRKKAQEAWTEFRKLNKFNRREKELVNRLFRDGEVFLRCFEDTAEGAVKIRFIRADLVAEPRDKKNVIKNGSFGIVTDPDDIEEVLGYIRCDREGNYKERLKPEEVIHIKIFCDSDQKRGVSVYRVCAKRLKQYEEWLEDRVVLNKIRSAIALVRQIDSSAAKVKAIRDESLSDQYSTGKRRVRTPHRGTVITASKGIEYKMLTPNINASDSADDGKAILLAVAAAVGFPEQILTGDYSNINYSSSLVAQNPFVREIEDWQDFLSDFYTDMYERVIKAKIKANKLPNNTKATCKVEFPPMILAELEKLAKAYEIMFKYKIISKKTWRGKQGLDDEVESQNIEDEEGDEVYGQPPAGHPNQYPMGRPGPGGQFNMPLAPMNQLGKAVVQLWEAFRREDWDKVIEIGEELKGTANAETNE